MTRITRMLLIGALAMPAAAHAQKRAEHSYCQALSTLTTDLKRLENAPKDADMKEHRALVDQIKQDAMSVEKDALKTRTPAGKQLVMSSRKLSQDTNDMPEDMPKEAAHAKIKEDLQAVKQSATQLATESGCPAALPGAERAKPPAGEPTHTY